MAFTFSDQGNNSVYGTGSVAAAAVNVAADDLIVVSIGSGNDAVWCTGVTDTEGNTYTVRTAVGGIGGYCNLVMAYCIGAAVNASTIVTATFNNATSTRKNIIVSIYTPDSGETVTLDVAMNKAVSSEDSPWETGTDDTTGTDELCVAGLQAGGTSIYSAHEIPGGTAAIALSDPGNNSDGWYRILTSTASGLYAEIDSDVQKGYSMEMLCFKSVVSLSLEQEGFRWRADDGSESGASGLAAQDVDITRVKETNTRLRILLNATGNPDAAQYKLQYKKTSSGTWRDMPES